MPYLKIQTNAEVSNKADQTAGLSALLCSFCKEELNVPEDRVYIEFSSAEGVMWGWNGRTF